MITRVSFFVCLLCVALINAKSNRIVGGDDAHPGQFKYMISLEDSEDIVCGAAIIADQYVLTAAHCVVTECGKFYSSKYYVVAGSTHIRTNEGVRIEVEKIYVPNTYRPWGKRNDIAVLKLCKGLGLCSNPNLQKVDLPPNTEQRESYYVGRPAVISGYGVNYVEVGINPITHEEEEFNEHMDGKLRYLMTNIISNEECNSYRKRYRIDDNQICTKTVQREGQPRGICTCDSGGPLVSDNIIIGVASISPTGCREDDAPAIYTRVSSFIDFIENAMKNVKTMDMFIREIHSCESSSGSSSKRKSMWS